MSSELQWLRAELQWPRAALVSLRLDNMVALSLGVSRSKANVLIESGKIYVDGIKEEKKKRLVTIENKVTITTDHGVTSLSEAAGLEKLDEPQGEMMELDIHYEDEEIIVVNKPKGMLVHPTTQQMNGTLVNGLLAHCNLAKSSGKWRPGILHRLDRDTSGLIVAAKTDAAYENLRLQFDEHQVEKLYLALTRGFLKESEGVVTAPIGRPLGGGYRRIVTEGGKWAKTAYSVKANFSGYQLVQLKLVTGRTHQIRVHMAHLGHPLLGDWLYGNIKFKKEKDGTMYEVVNGIKLKGQMLHSGYLSFAHPKSGKKMTFTSLPEKSFLELCKPYEEALFRWEGNVDENENVVHSKF